MAECWRGDQPLYNSLMIQFINTYPDSKVHGANMGPIWGRQDPGGPHGGPMNFAIWVYVTLDEDEFNSPWCWQAVLMRNLYC